MSVCCDYCKYPLTTDQTTTCKYCLDPENFISLVNKMDSELHLSNSEALYIKYIMTYVPKREKSMQQVFFSSGGHNAKTMQIQPQ
jgi:hypothetical protein